MGDRLWVRVCVGEEVRGELEKICCERAQGRKAFRHAVRLPAMSPGRSSQGKPQSRGSLPTPSTTQQTCDEWPRYIHHTLRRISSRWQQTHPSFGPNACNHYPALLILSSHGARHERKPAQMQRSSGCAKPALHLMCEVEVTIITRDMLLRLAWRVGVQRLWIPGPIPCRRYAASVLCDCEPTGRIACTLYECNARLAAVEGCLLVDESQDASPSTSLIIVRRLCVSIQHLPSRLPMDDYRT